MSDPSQPETLTPGLRDFVVTADGAINARLSNGKVIGDPFMVDRLLKLEQIHVWRAYMRWKGIPVGYFREEIERSML